MIDSRISLYLEAGNLDNGDCVRGQDTDSLAIEYDVLKIDFVG